ncbi:MAG: hypothetical protein AB1816_21230 [Bacillota bacterium]
MEREMPNDGLVEALPGGLALALEGVLVPGEEVVVCLRGCPGEALVATQSRLIVVKAGFPSGAWFGRKVKWYPYHAVTSVEVSCGLLLGRVQVTVAGSAEADHGLLGDAPLDALVGTVQAENVVTFPVWKRARFAEAARAVWGLLGALRGGVACG